MGTCARMQRSANAAGFRFVCVVAGWTLSACASVPSDFVYAEERTDALLLLKSRPMEPNSWTASMTLVPLDLAEGVVTGDAITPQGGGNRSLRRGDVTTPADYVGVGFAASPFFQAILPAGDYAIISVDERPRSPIEGTVTCYAENAPVLRARRGTVNVARDLDELFSEWTEGPSEETKTFTLRAARSALTNYPGVTAPVASADLVAVVRFEQQRTDRPSPEHCQIGGSFDVLSELSAAP